MFFHRFRRIHKAVQKNDITALRRLIADGADVNIGGGFKTTPLHWAAKAGCTQMCLELLQAGAHLDARDRYGSTPLHYAVSSDQPEACAMLISHGALVDIVADSSGRTALHLAAEARSETMCGALLDAGADQLIVDRKGNLAISIAIAHRAVDICRLLEKRHPGISAVKPADGFLTPFQYAVFSGRAEIVRVLVLECGVDLHQRSEGGRTLFDFADDSEEMTGLLRALNTELSVGSAIAPSAGGEAALRRRSNSLAL